MTLKRVVDIVGASIMAVALSPVMLMLALLVRLRLGSPIFYTQVRPGMDGKPFRLIKFRSMTFDRGADGQLLGDEKRLPPFGRWLRSTSLDELPELWNVLKGDMSLVGPRPLLMEYLPLYSPEQAVRHNVRPGLTGLAQIRGRNELPWERRFQLDAWYVENCSLCVDFKILWKTLFKVLTREGISENGSATARPFSGNISE